MEQSVATTIACIITLRNRNTAVMCQRLTGDFAGYWQFPSGKVEHGELPVHAAARELKEESGIIAPTSELLWLGNHDAVTTKGVWKQVFFLLLPYRNMLFMHKEPEKHGPWRDFNIEELFRRPDMLWLPNNANAMNLALEEHNCPHFCVGDEVVRRFVPPDEPEPVVHTITARKQDQGTW